MPMTYGLSEPVDLALPHLPDALAGLRIAHISDLHIRKPRDRYQRMIHQLTSQRIDLVFHSGDYMSRPGDEDAALSVMSRICEGIRPLMGSFGVFGNHDSDELIDRCLDLPVRWLINEAVSIQQGAIEILGLSRSSSRQADSVALALSMAGLDFRRDAHETDAAGQASGPVRLMIAHHPDMLPTAADLEADLMFAGHTHGGQCRLPGGQPLINSSPLPLRLTCGELRHRNTTAMVCRGVGEVTIPLRLFCPPHVPIYTLRRRPMAGRYTDEIENVQPW